MRKSLKYLSEKKYIVFKDGIDIGAVVYGRLYRYDTGKPIDTYTIRKGSLYKAESIVGELVGLKIFTINEEILELEEI